jgi:aminoglycoside phosphotransferase (APT) family kinase protein
LRRALAFLLLAAIGCQAPPPRQVIAPLPEDIAPQAYADLVGRARQQAMMALESYYVDHWAEVEDSARGLEQTARFLRKARDIPPARQADLGMRTESLAQAAKQLRDAAQAKASDQVNMILQRINAQVRELK